MRRMRANAVLMVCLVVAPPAVGSPASTTTSMHFDCREDLDRWQKDWSVWKKAWCCRHSGGQGCPTTTTTEALSQSETATATQYEATLESTGTRTSTSDTSTSTRAHSHSASAKSSSTPTTSTTLEATPALPVANETRNASKRTAEAPPNATSAGFAGQDRRGSPQDGPTPSTTGAPRSTAKQAKVTATTNAQGKSASRGATNTSARATTTTASAVAPATTTARATHGNSSKAAAASHSATTTSATHGVASVRSTTAKPTSTTVTAETQKASDSTDCDVECVHQGKTMTCREHVQVVAFKELLGTPDSCKAALNITRSRCSACAGCGAEAAGCDVLSAVAIPQARSPLEACAENCAVGDQVASCRDRIKWSAINTFQSQVGACKSGLDLVLGQCPSCAGCTLEGSRCSVGRDAPQDSGSKGDETPDCSVGEEQDWGASKRQFCCESAGRGCAVRGGSSLKFRKQFELQEGWQQKLPSVKTVGLLAAASLCLLVLTLASVRLCASRAEPYLPVRETAAPARSPSRRGVLLQEELLARVLQSGSGPRTPRHQLRAVEAVKEQCRSPSFHM